MAPPRQRMRLTPQEGQDENGQPRRDTPPPPTFAEPCHELPLTRRQMKEELRPLRELISQLRHDVTSLTEELRGFFLLFSLSLFPFLFLLFFAFPLFFLPHFLTLPPFFQEEPSNLCPNLSSSKSSSGSKLLSISLSSPLAPIRPT